MSLKCHKLVTSCHRSVTARSQVCHEMSPRCHELSLASQLRQIADCAAPMDGFLRARDDVKMFRKDPGRHGARCVQRRNDGLRFLEFHIFVACVAGVSHVSQDCHRDVARLSRSVTRCRRCVARCHRDVTAESHICHTLSQAVATTVIPITPCHRVSIHLSTCKQVDISPLGWGVTDRHATPTV